MMAMAVQTQAFLHAFGLVLSMICAMGPQNLHVLSTGLHRRHVGVTVGLCVMADAVLVAAALTGVAGLTDGQGPAAAALRWTAAAWMLVWACKAFRAACRAPIHAAPSARSRGARAAVLATAWVTLGNPSAYVETLVVLGGSGAAWAGDARWSFGAGAVAASLGWFCLLGFGARVLAPCLLRPQAWRVLQSLSGGMMAVIGIRLVADAAWPVA